MVAAHEPCFLVSTPSFSPSFPQRIRTNVRGQENMAEMTVYHFQGQLLKDLWVLPPFLRLLATVEVTAMS